MVNHSESFVVDLEGYEPEYVTIKRDQWNGMRTAGGVIGGLFIFPVFATLLWAADYKEAYNVELREATEQQDEAVQPVRASRRAAPERQRSSRR